MPGEPASLGPAAAERQTQRRRALITLGLVALALFWAVWFAWSYIRADDDRVASKTPAPTCRAIDPKAITPAKTTVNVYNGGGKDGLAASTSKQLAARGFVIANVANGPNKKTIAGVGEVRYGPQGEAQAKLVLGVVRGAKGVKDARKTAVVDLVIGTKWVPLKPAPAATGLPACPESS